MKKGLLLFVLLAVQTFAQTEIGIVEKVILYTPTGQHDVVATIDTGADSTSIDSELAQSLGLVPNEDLIIITDARGNEQRNTVDLHFTLADREIYSVGTIANRSDLSTKMLIGTKDLHSFIIKPEETFLTIPDWKTQGRFMNKLGHVLDREYIRLILIIPMLSIIILVLRHIIGLQTYGIFGPLIIAVSIYQTGFITGTLMFIILVIIGLLVKRVISHFSMPLITELSIVMFFLALGTVLVTAVFSTSVLLQAIFPMIITTFLVERFTQQIELHEAKVAFATLLTTLTASVILAFMISLVMTLSKPVMLALFFLSLAACILLGNYVGLRLTEVFRFKLLEK